MDTWTIPPEMRAKYDARFEIIQQGGAVTGDVARALFLKSGLPPQVLAKIWALADMDADGRIDKKEFSIALWLIAMKLKGIEVPDRLPASMLAPPPRPPPSADPFVATGATPPRPGPPPPVPPAPALSAMVPPVAIPAAGRVGGPPPKPPPPVNMPPPKPAPPVIPPAPQVVPSSGIGSVQPGEWAVAQQTKLKYTQLFNQHDRQRTGFLTGNQARGILMQTGLPNAVLAQIWQLSDIDTDGRLTSEEFVLAMHLCEQSRSGQQLPTTLPVDLVPPSYRRRNSGARHDSVGSVGSAGSRGISGQEAIVSPPMTQESAELIGSLSVGYATFEDRRRENFEKGQAELERRRQIIVEQQKREQQERERKERDEMLRKQKMRQEQERKRQEELEAERERQRQRTEELEAERKRMQEQKEAARKEMERQRELELQRQRITEMTALKQRTQEGLSLLKRRKLDLCLQVERLSREVGEVNGKMAVQKEEVATAKAFIDGMRPQRDEIMSELSEIKARLKECSDEALLLNQEKLNMQNQLASLKSKAGNKKRELETKIEMARKQLQQLTNEVKNKTAEVEKSEKEVEDKENAKNAANHDESVWVSVAPAKEDKAEDLSKPKWDDPTEVNWGDEAAKTAPVVPPPPTQATMDAWGDTKPSPDVSVGGNWGTDNIAKSWADPNGTTVQAGAISTKKKEEEATKYRAVYKFEARNEDELSFQPGDIIKVTVGEQGEPGWLAGELRGKSGWFPKSYVEPVDGGALTWDSAPAETEVRSTPLDTVEEEPGAGEGEAIYYALYQYNSTEAGDLCFPAGAAIKVTQKNGDWWTGTYNGASGMFPGNYVSADELVNAEPEAVTNVPAAQVATEDERQSEKANGKRSSTPNDSKKSMKKKPEIVVVVANYDASGDGQLNLVKGQLVQVRKKTDGGWWEGEIHYKGKGRKSGWFPASYVKVLAGPGVGEKSATGAAASTLASASSQETSTESVRGEKVKAVYDFQGQQEDELNFVLDEIIVVTNKDDPAWWKGYKASDGPTMEGLFPSNYVEPISGDGDALIKNMLYHPIDNYLPTYTNDPSLANFELCRRPGNNSSVNRRENNQSLTSTVTVEENTYQEIEDLTTYGSQEDSRNGDLYINVADDNAMKSASGTWFHSSVANLYCDIDSLDQQDVANNNELSSITNKMSLQQQLSDYNQRPQSLSLNNGTESKVASSPVKDRPSSLDVKTFSRSLSSQRFSPAKLTHVNYEDILNMIHQNPELDAKEKKRQSSIYELISTEQSYVKDLMLVEKYFVRPMKKSGRVSAEDASRMIANWRELITCSDKILKALKIRQTMSPDHVIVTIGDIIVENTTTLQPYIRFCSRQSQAMQLIQQRTEQDPWFGEIYLEEHVE
ncbi:intersectin-1-like isoform X4 [Varroa destructor]|uniref:Intersectin-1 n=1 Tax=Varroa destructor TaxID=109461 RepID=A0A7M7JQ49_VARDE|nr:intersectin-1-like isoform X4 [Varroa destructor]